jgi:hypothetical protein
MLRSTDEYKTFAEFGSDQGLRFLKHIHSVQVEQQCKR